jgi:hypothetical protein
MPGMNPLPPQLYAEWRRQNLALPILHDTTTAPVPPERLLQAIWRHQRLRRECLHTLDGRTVRVLHPGFPNRGAGPDFRQAVLQFDADTPRTGDIEVDLQVGNWRSHGHHVNPAFQKVQLLVIWEGAPNAQVPMPILALKPVLDSPITDLTLWLGSDAAREWPPDLNGHCHRNLSQLPEAIRTGLLRQAAYSRLQAKAAFFEARARQVGWEQSLWEGLFRALGYKQNIWPMQRIAELLPLWPAANRVGTPLAWQARLLGIGGLLPADEPTGTTETGQYLRRLWEHWWREREAVIDQILPHTMWCFQGLRPANYPQRRLALAAHWLAQGDLISKLEGWFTATIPDHQLVASVLDTLQASPDDFWSWRWTFRSKRRPHPQPFIGAARASDLVINVILPWFWVRAVTGQNLPLQQTAEHRYFDWPKTEDNSVLRLARQRLFGETGARQFRLAADQQGLLQIVRDFCDHSNAICDQCLFPQMTASLL